VRHLGRLKCVTDGGAVSDSADILAACDGTTPPGSFVRTVLGFRGGDENEP